jgi:hypothetical protein
VLTTINTDIIREKETQNVIVTKIDHSQAVIPADPGLSAAASLSPKGPKGLDTGRNPGIEWGKERTGLRFATGWLVENELIFFVCNSPAFPLAIFWTCRLLCYY